MLNLIETLAVLTSQFSGTNLQTFATIVESVLCLSGSVTTLSVSRMSEVSYRTVQRFYALKSLDWLGIRLLLFRAFIYRHLSKIIDVCVLKRRIYVKL